MSLANCKILRIYLRIPPANGGMENHILQLTKQQRGLGAEVVLAFNDGVKTAENDIQILKKHKLYPRFSTLTSIFIFYIFLVLSLVRDRRRYDIIHIHGDWTSFIFASLIKKLTRAKIACFSMHGSVKLHSGWQSRFLKRSLKIADVVFSTGFENYELIKSFCKKAVFQPSGVSDVFFNSTGPIYNDTKEFRIITIGNLFPVKNTRMTIEIAARLPKIEFVIVGEGPEYNLLLELSNSLNCKNIVFKGRLSKEEVMGELLKSKLFLFTSVLEGTPTAIMEAMACGLPIVTSNAGKVDSIVSDAVNGFVIQNYNIDNYISKITELYNNEELRKVMSDNNKKKATQFSWEVVASLITDIQTQYLDGIKKDKQ